MAPFPFSQILFSAVLIQLLRGLGSEYEIELKCHDPISTSLQYTNVAHGLHRIKAERVGP